MQLCIAVVVVVPRLWPLLPLNCFAPYHAPTPPSTRSLTCGRLCAVAAVVPLHDHPGARRVQDIATASNWQLKYSLLGQLPATSRNFHTLLSDRAHDEIIGEGGPHCEGSMAPRASAKGVGVLVGRVSAGGGTGDQA